MKKLWKAKNDKEGVSPVIATILMVAITVVLAAILMVMVMGMTGGTDLEVGMEQDGTNRIKVTYATTSMERSNVKIFLLDSSGAKTGDEIAGSWSTAGTVLAGSVFTATSDFATDSDYGLFYKDVKVGAVRITV